jgi:hypothetical protein
MRHLWTRPRALAFAYLHALAQFIQAADHGPAFALATSTNPQEGWSFDLGVNGRSGVTSTLEAELTYGLTQNIKLAVSGPVVFHADPFPRSSVTTNTPISGDFDRGGMRRLHLRGRENILKRLVVHAGAAISGHCRNFNVDTCGLARIELGLGAAMAVYFTPSRAPVFPMPRRAD